jgi:hypothetical protein
MALVKIDPEFEALIPALSPEEYALLELNILREGCRDPLRQWGDILLDGHNRYRICKKHDRPYGVTPIELPDREAAILWIMENQLGRRNLPDAYRTLLIEDIAERRAKANRAEQLKYARKGESAVVDENVHDSKDRKRTRTKVAKEQGVSEHALKQAKKIRDAAKTDPKAREVVKKLRDGQIKSLAAAVRQIEPEAAPIAKPKKMDSGIVRAMMFCLDSVIVVREMIEESGELYVLDDDAKRTLESARELRSSLDGLIAQLERERKTKLEDAVVVGGVNFGGVN